MKKKSLVGWTYMGWKGDFHPTKKLRKILLGGYINDEFAIPSIYPLKKDWNGTILPSVKVRITIEEIK